MASMDSEQSLWEKECDDKTIEVEMNLISEKLRRKKKTIKKMKEERSMLITEIKKLQSENDAGNSKGKNLGYLYLV